MSRTKPRSVDYSPKPGPKARRPERPGELVKEGKPKGKLKALLDTPRAPREEEQEAELDRLAATREGSAYLTAILEGMLEGEG